jgi:hypothetical protein
MQEFFAQIDAIKGNISFIQASTTQIVGMKDKVCAQPILSGKEVLPSKTSFVQDWRLSISNSELL